MKELLTGVVATGALAAGFAQLSANNAESAEPIQSIPSMSAAQAEQTTRTFDRIKADWLGQQVSVDDVQLELVTGTETYMCGDGTDGPVIPAKAMTDYILSYCQLDNTIVVTDSGVQLMYERGPEMGISGKGMMQVVLAHEFGHAVAKATHTTDGQTTFAQEQEADCYAGSVLEDLGSSMVSMSRLFYQSIEGDIPDPNHGTVQQRYDAFQRGVSGDDC